jgi:flagellar motor switch protein FliN/FliY
MTDEVAVSDETAVETMRPSGEPDPAATTAAIEGGEQAESSAVREAQFASLSGAVEQGGGPSMDMILDLEVDLTAELGRTAMLIRDLMELRAGSIIELRKVVGEPVDLLANGKIVARGEVVVVDESFGVRVSEVVRGAVRPGGAS